MIEQLPKASFVLIQPQVPPQAIKIDAQVVTIGRSAECTIPIKDRFLSRKHAEVVQVGSEWVLRDCESANGTLLNGLRVRQEVPLRPGDRIGVGDCELVFGEEIPTPSQVITLDGPASHTIASSILLSDVTSQTDEEDRAPVAAGDRFPRRVELSTLGHPTDEVRGHCRLDASGQWRAVDSHRGPPHPPRVHRLVEALQLHLADRLELGGGA